MAVSGAARRKELDEGKRKRQHGLMEMARGPHRVPGGRAFNRLLVWLIEVPRGLDHSEVHR